MAYIATEWVDDVTPINAENLNKMERGIKRSSDVIDETADFVVETGVIEATTSGVTGDWTYRKWSNGVVECWGKFSRTAVAVNTAIGSSGWYRSTNLGDKYPSGLFNTITYVNIKPVFWSSGSIIDSHLYQVSGTAQVQWVVQSTASNDSMTFEYSVEAIGTWK